MGIFFMPLSIFIKFWQVNRIFGRIFTTKFEVILSNIGRVMGIRANRNPFSMTYTTLSTKSIQVYCIIAFCVAQWMLPWIDSCGGKKQILKINKIKFLPTDPIFFGHETGNTGIFLFGLRRIQLDKVSSWLDLFGATCTWVDPG